ncbi:cyclin-T1-3-like [Lolium rigidum]|uniref:cyclin-T1-3-like n=1 Tax=Lolium rigidum TaxID=89674 RepID=UPI001F5C89EB|nr:cyclin-T1-3-like [Lolium rigidum]
MDIMQTSDSSQYGIVENSPYRIPYDRHAEDVNLGASWYFSRKEIEENSLSRRDGIDLKKESYLRKSYCTYLQELGVRLKVPPVTIATAVVFCHRFFLRQSHARNDRMTIATVCMFLAGKVEETPRPLKDVILISYEVIHKKDPAAVARIKQKEVYEKQKELLLIGERVVLVTLDFDLNIHHPYKPLVKAIEKFNKVAQKALAQAAWSFVNDGLRTSLCLQFKPQHIAAGAIFLATKFLKIKLPADGENFWLQQFDVTPRQLEEVSNQMLELYGPPPGQDTKDSPASVSALEEAPGASKEPSSQENDEASTQSSMPGRHGPEKPSSGIPANESCGVTVTSNEGPSMLSSTADAMKKLDKDKVKAAPEKHGDSNGDAGRKVDAVDGADLIGSEVERGVELAAEDEGNTEERRQSLPNPPHREDHQNVAGTAEDTEEDHQNVVGTAEDTEEDHQNVAGMAEDTEEGELSMDIQEHLYPELDSRKRKDVQEHVSRNGSERDLKRPRS